MSLHARTSGDAVVLTIDRPATRNAIDRKLARRIGEAIRIASADPSVRGIVLTSEGSEVFISGGDLKDLQRLSQDAQGGREVMAMFDDLAVIERCEVPVIAAVQGDVIGGGCELLLLCDMAVMERHAEIAFRQAKMGLSTAWGGMTRLVERVGPIEAARLLLTAEKVGADEALRIGLVNQVVASGTSLANAVARVNRIADNPRATVAAIKRTLFEVRECRRAFAPARERAAFEAMWGGSEHRQAMDAFFSRKT